MSISVMAMAEENDCPHANVSKHSGGYIYLQWSSATRQAYYQVDTMGDDCYAWLDDVIVIEGGYIRTECWISSGLTNVY